MPGARGGFDFKLDRDRRCGKESDESVELQGSEGGAALAERGGARGIRDGVGWGEGNGGGVGEVWDCGDLWRMGGREFASEGSEFAGGRHGWNFFRREGEFGNFGESNGG